MFDSATLRTSLTVKNGQERSLGGASLQYLAKPFDKFTYDFCRRLDFVDLPHCLTCQ